MSVLAYCLVIKTQTPEFFLVYIQVSVSCLQGFPEFGDDEIVSVPDAKYTKGEFEVSELHNGKNLKP